jgi:hypothetical protein
MSNASDDENLNQSLETFLKNFDESPELVDVLLEELFKIILRN